MQLMSAYLLNVQLRFFLFQSIISVTINHNILMKQMQCSLITLNRAPTHEMLFVCGQLTR